ncbi:MAG: glycosyltransferase family 2 protein [Proteobacteria bacterium]|nr:glycosyltransferase family 2 protein [Pseudomonadota bacterium]
MLAIILSTYNGATYIRAQLDSILNQTLQTELILIRDDGSTDETKSILKEYQAKYHNIELIEDNLGNIGVLRSYSLLLQKVASLDIDYCMFADQDDVWYPNKTEILLAEIKTMNKERAALVFSDVELVDTNLQQIAPSLVAYQKLMPEQGRQLKALLFYSPALGCTMIFNKFLVDNLVALNDNFPNPDKWALLVAACLGDIKYVPVKTLKYRQHQRNITGALKGIHRKKLSLENINFLQKRYQTALNEARILEKHLPIMPNEHQVILKRFNALFTGNIFKRLYNYCYFSMCPPHWQRKAGLFASLFLKYK